MTAERLYPLARLLIDTRHDPDAQARQALAQTAKLAGCADACLLLLPASAPTRAFAVGAAATDPDAQAFWQRSIDQGIIGHVAQARRPLIVRSTDGDPRWDAADRALFTTGGSAFALPLLTAGRVIGVVMFVSSAIDAFDESMQALLTEAAAVLAGSISITRLDQDTQPERTDVEADDARDDRDALRRDLMAMTFHDLRGPLNNVQTSLAMLERRVEKSGDATAGELIAMALRATRQTARMVHSLLDLERLEDGRAVIQRKRTAMRDVLTNSIDIVRPSALEGGQTLVVEIADAMPPVEIDADMIQRVIVNLVENAIKHTPRNGEITLRTSLSAEGLYISVSDTGPGVPRQHLKEIFDKYYRVRHANAGSGTGLGLAFCRLAVEAHGGRIWVESDPGNGATFAFILPIANANHNQ